MFDDALGFAPRSAVAAREVLVERGFAVAFAAGLLWTPFWLGGAWRLPWGVNALLFPGLALGYEAARLATGRAPPFAFREIGAPAALFLAAIGWAWLQTTTLLPAPIIAAVGARTPATISVDPTAGALALTRLITDACAFYLAAALARDPIVARALLAAVAVIAALYSGYGLYLVAAYDNAIPGFAAADGGFEVRSTFVNRNSFAAFAGLGLMSALALASIPRREVSRRNRWARAFERAGENAAPIAAGLVILSALLGSASRGGILATTLGAVTLLGLTAARKRSRRVSLVALACGGLVLIAGAARYGGRMWARFAESGLSDGERLGAYRTALRAIAERPLLGFGYGTFSDVFPLFREASLSPVGVWEMAHNAYLESAIGLGLIFAGALTLALALVASTCISACLDRASAAPLAASGSAALMSADALVDYSLEIEAVALTFMTLLGAGFAQSLRRVSC